MADEILKRDQNRIVVLGGVTDDSNQYITMLRVDPTTKRLLVSATGGSAGTVTSVSVVTANGFAGTVATPTVTPAITISTSVTGILLGDGTAVTGLSSSGTGNVVRVTSPTLVTPILGVATATSITGTTTLSLAGKDGSGSSAGSLISVAGGAGGGTSGAGGAVNITAGSALGGNSNGGNIVIQAGSKSGAGTVGQIKFTDVNSGFSATLATATIAADRTFTFPDQAGIFTVLGNTTTGSGNIVLATSPTLVTPILGVPTSGTLTNCTGLPAASVVAGTLGTGAYVMDTKLTVPQIINTNNAITATANAATVPITSRISTVTNSSAATLTITITTTSAVDGQTVIVRILDFSAVAQTITWVNTENSTVSAPTTSNGSTTLPLTVGFMYNANTSKWRCVASA